MKTMKKVWKGMVLAMLAVLFAMCMTVSADDASGDNSLYSLGLENGECSPEFYYSTLEYNVTVPAGTEELLLDPITSASDASIIDISGTKLDENGSGTVYITVEAANGAQVSYVLNVSSDGAAVAETTAETEMSDEQKYEEELRKQAESEEAARQEAELQAKAEQAEKISAENDSLKEKLNLLMKVLYGLIGFAVLLLFFIINQSLRNKDLKDDLKEARAQADLNTDFARRSENMRSDYYYTPVHNMQQSMGQPMMDASANVQAAFGNASQVLQAQPMPGQVNAPMQNMQMNVQPEKELSRKEQKKLEKAAKKAAKAQSQPVMQDMQPMMQANVPVQNVQAPVSMEPTLVQGREEEPDVNVDMIDL
ncbi:MAG: hypothetical protein Q4F83_01500 [Eubacteriales bacterium]|nr:hypothetical protein [Eubacteriales bacterium]